MSAPSIFKVLPRLEFVRAIQDGVYQGSPVDHADGFIHFSAAEQVIETIQRHFAGQADLILLSVATEPLGDALVWETSRRGDLFPHLYGDLSLAAIEWAEPIDATSLAITGDRLDAHPNRCEPPFSADDFSQS